VPARFVFAVKASRYLTHMKKLKTPRDPLRRMLRRAGHLGPTLGPVTADFVYVRRHGTSPGKYHGAYTDAMLRNDARDVRARGFARGWTSTSTSTTTMRATRGATHSR